eukprot:COSAG02_NODE_2221_length_9469_cov_3.478975_6_plen_104_part_00
MQRSVTENPLQLVEDHDTAQKNESSDKDNGDNADVEKALAAFSPEQQAALRVLLDQQEKAVHIKALKAATEVCTWMETAPANWHQVRIQHKHALADIGMGEMT